MQYKIDLQEKSVSFSVPKSLYTMEGLQIAAHIIGHQADVYLTQSKTSFELTLNSKRSRAIASDLENLAGEFLNELLNQEYRFVVGRFNQKISSLIVTQALFSARGGEEPPKPREEEQTPEFKAAVEELMKEAEEDIRRTMPKKIAPQGTPLPPVPEESRV